MGKHGNSSELVHLVTYFGELLLSVFVNTDDFYLVGFTWACTAVTAEELRVQTGPFDLQFTVAKVLTDVQVLGLASTTTLSSALLGTLRTDE